MKPGRGHEIIMCVCSFDVSSCKHSSLIAQIYFNSFEKSIILIWDAVSSNVLSNNVPSVYRTSHALKSTCKSHPSRSPDTRSWPPPPLSPLSYLKALRWARTQGRDPQEHLPLSSRPTRSLITHINNPKVTLKHMHTAFQGRVYDCITLKLHASIKSLQPVNPWMISTRHVRRLPILNSMGPRRGSSRMFNRFFLRQQRAG